MVFDATEANPMWASPSALARMGVLHGNPLPGAGERACRIALRSTEMQELIGGGGPARKLMQIPTWDTPLTLLADDDDLAERLRAAGILVPPRAGTYAERQWDARERLEEAAHRYYDHGEMAWGVRGMTALEPRVAVLLVEGGPLILSLLTHLVRNVARAGVVLDARDRSDLRVFGIESLDRGRMVTVLPDRLEEHPGDPDIDHMLRDILSLG